MPPMNREEKQHNYVEQLCRTFLTHFSEKRARNYTSIIS